MIIAYILRNANIKKSKNYSYSFLNTSPDPLLANFFLLQYNLRKSIIMGKAGEIHMYSFLVNPASRSGRGQKYWERIKSILEERLIPYQVFFSKGPGDMVNLSRRLTGALTPDGEDIHLVVLGGDGTANEVVQGIENFPKPVSAIFLPVPATTSHGIPESAVTLWKRWNAFWLPPGNSPWM